LETTQKKKSSSRSFIHPDWVKARCTTAKFEPKQEKGCSKTRVGNMLTRSSSLLLCIAALAAFLAVAHAVPIKDADQLWECRAAPSTPPSFCSMIDYQYNVTYVQNGSTSYWDEQSGNDSFAQSVYEAFTRQLSVYNCLEYNRYWTCDNCSDAYKVWLCAVLFPKCSDQTVAQTNITEWKNAGNNGGPMCQRRCTYDEEVTANSTGVTPTDCMMETVPWHRCVPQTKTCRGVCYDVVRKCPVHLGFKCPLESDTRDYTGPPWTTAVEQEIKCNYINMTMSVEPPSGASVLVASAFSAIIALVAAVALL